MSTVIGLDGVKKDKLCSTANYKTNFKSFQGFENDKNWYNRLENSVKNHIDEKYRHFLAQPVVDVDDDSIVWYAQYDETPQRLSELQEEERTRYEEIKNNTLAHYHSVINSLKQGGKAAEAEYLERATKFADNPDFFFCFADKVVLGVWGMQLRDKVREPIGTIAKGVYVEKPKPPTVESPPIAPQNPPPVPDADPIPESPEPEPIILSPPPLPLPTVPWYKRFWNWLCALFIGRGCLKWLLWLLLLLLLLLLLCWLFRSCNGNQPPISFPIEDKPWIGDNPNAGKGGIYNPGDPYTPAPTPPGYDDVLPPMQGVLPPAPGVLPPIEDDPDIIPGNPSIIGNRLNILMENEDKSIMDLAKDFKAKYPDEKYKIVYYDDVVKRMQIDIPREEREQLKQEIPGKFAPQYELFVFDEALFETGYTPTDPAFSDRDKSWYLNAIHAPQAWDITCGSPKLTVAIVDNGFNLKHPELSSKVVMPYNVWKHSSEVFPQQEDHGTHVAGTALAIANNGKGICGIAPECKFMPIQVADARGLMTTTSVLDGVLYALYQGADVVNVSLGGQFKGLDQYSKSAQEDLIRNHFKEEERLWREIMRIAAKHNATIVIAAGNDNVLAGIEPMQRPELFVTVSAVDKNNRNFGKAGFSNYGSYSTISAPGVDIYSSVGVGDYQTMDGTSMAAPIVTGAIALMKSLNDTLTTKQIICILQGTGLPAQGNIGNLIQLDKALQKVKSGETVDCTATPTPSTGDVQVFLSWNNYNDLDLICTDPQGASVWYKNKRVPSGGQLEIDMNVEYPDSKTPIENIYWAQGGAPNGTYNVYLRYFKKHESNIDETPYTIKVKHGEKTDEYQGVIKKEDNAINICTFTLGDAGNIQNPGNPSTPPSANRRSQLEQERNRLQEELARVNAELRRIENSR
ncbi:hypothetical protein SAMD00024442_11_52 [Candidatus Symbiothrix dinenymphae]|nr:hypothetical protein SAMD00024442_11_52 [Candidatus Symbiothrix dinenymphae]